MTSSYKASLRSEVSSSLSGFLDACISPHKGLFTQQGISNMEVLLSDRGESTTEPRVRSPFAHVIEASSEQHVVFRNGTTGVSSISSSWGRSAAPENPLWSNLVLKVSLQIGIQSEHMQFQIRWPSLKIVSASYDICMEQASRRQACSPSTSSVQIVAIVSWRCVQPVKGI